MLISTTKLKTEFSFRVMDHIDYERAKKSQMKETHLHRSVTHLDRSEERMHKVSEPPLPLPHSVLSTQSGKEGDCFVDKEK